MEFVNLDDTVQLTGGALAQPVRFLLRPDLPETIAGWEVRVFDESDRVVKTITGDGSSFRVLEWDGQMDDGGMIRPGSVYSYQLLARWSDGATATSPRRLFGVNVTSLIALNLMGEAFETGSDRLSGKASEMLAKAAQTLRAYPDERVVLEGHTDSEGSRESNLDLSRRRAQAAVDSLVREHGLSASS
jgi:hypothetical protein